MQAPFDNIVQHLFHQPSLQSVTVDELDRMAQAHPYFAAAHFLLLKKMQQTDHPQFTAQLHKTTLYFNNPLWLQFLLQPETVQGFTVLDKSPFIAEEIPATTQDNETPVEEPAHFPVAAVQDDALAAMPAATDFVSEPHPVTPIMPETIASTAGMMDVITEVFQEAAATPGEPASITADLPATVYNDEITQAIHEPVEMATNVRETPEPEPEPMPIPSAPVDEAPIPQETWLPDAMITAVNEQEGHWGTVVENEIPISAPTEPVTEPVAENGQAFSQDTPAVAENPEEADATDAPFTESNALETPLFKNIIETQAASSDTLFEPYHTVDYFASQGIKLSKLEIDAKDKLGRQLKSFTEWLKTMKRLPQVSIDKLLSENEESKVVADAIHSIENKEVITEAMAEVFEKQGMHEKAVEVYQKLSLLNPAKSTYFAAKIAILKH